MYCLYQQYQAEKNEINLSDTMQEIGREWNQNVRSKETVLFLVSHLREWENVRLLWNEKIKSPESIPYLVILSYYDKDYDGSPMEWHMEDAIGFAKSAGVDDSRILNVKQISAEYLELLHPEQIYIQNPYDEWNSNISIPLLFYASNIRKYTDELIYVSPYGEGELYGKASREYRNMQYYVAMPGVMYADRILLNSENKKKWYVEKLSEFAGEETKESWQKKIEVWNTEVNSWQQYEQKNSEVTGKKKLLYGISLGTYMEDPEAAVQKIKNNLHIFEEHKDNIEVAVYLFPENVNDTWKVIKEEIEDLFRNLQDKSGRMSTGWLLVEEQQVKHSEYDAYYGDPMPAVMEFCEQKKPVMIQNMLID